MNRREAYLRRTETVRREKLALLSVFIIILFISIFLIGSKTYANNNKSETNSIKKYRSVMIYSGDSLNSLADRYMGVEYSSLNTYVNEVASINGINVNSTLIPGNHIIVPYYEEIDSIDNIRCENPVIEIAYAK